MPNISRKIELLAASDHLHDLVKTYAFSSDDDTNALQNIFRASLEVSYLAQTQKDWALRILTQPVLSVATRVAIDTKWFLELADGNPKTAAEIARATSTETGLLSKRFCSNSSWYRRWSDNVSQYVSCVCSRPKV